MKCLLVFILIEAVNSFKLPNVNFDSDVSNIHDQYSDSIVNSTVTSINLSVVHIASEIILLILIICSYKRLSSLIYKMSLQFLNTKLQMKKAIRSSQDQQIISV
jgi:hypothetical protein